MTAVLLGLKRTVDRAPVELKDELHPVQEMIRSSLDEIRTVARRLRPGMLEDLGLPSALTALAADFTQASGIPIIPRLDRRLPVMSQAVEPVLYRIAQEGLTNIARHADATSVGVALNRGRAMWS